MLNKIEWRNRYRELRIAIITDDSVQEKMVNLGLHEIPDRRRPHVVEIQAIQDKMNVFREKKRRPIVLVDGQMWLPSWNDIVSGSFIYPVRPE